MKLAHLSLYSPTLIAVLLSGFGCSGDIEDQPEDKVLGTVTAPLVFDQDDRREAAEFTAQERQWANATGMLLDEKAVDCHGSWCQLITRPYTHQPNNSDAPQLCDTEQAYGQEKIAVGGSLCTAFLVGPDTAMTAGHCFTEQTPCENQRFVFGFEAQADGSNAQLYLPWWDVYSCSEVLHDAEDKNGDWAVFKLDRPTWRPYLEVDSDSRPPEGTPLTLFGYPRGTPLKVSTNGKALGDNHDDRTQYFTDLEATRGNSGGPVLNTETGKVVGILTQGPDGDEWEVDEASGCLRDKRCSAELGCVGKEDDPNQWTKITDVQPAAIVAGAEVSCRFGMECSSGNCQDGLCQALRDPNLRPCMAKTCDGSECIQEASGCLETYDQNKYEKTRMESVAAVFSQDDVDCSGTNPTALCDLDVSPLLFARRSSRSPLRQICDSSYFAGELTGAQGSAFLVGRDLVATAGHVVPDQASCDDTVFVFDFMGLGADPDSPETVPLSSVYSCAEVIESHSGVNGGPNWALLRLDRPTPSETSGVVRRRPIMSLHWRDNHPSTGSRAYLLGHPLGLEQRITYGEVVPFSGQASHEFRINAPVWRGIGGGPVLNDSGSSLVGILTGGPSVNDFVTDREEDGGLCSRVRTCDVVNGCNSSEPWAVVNDISALRVALENLQSN